MEGYVKEQSEYERMASEALTADAGFAEYQEALAKRKEKVAQEDGEAKDPGDGSGHPNELPPAATDEEAKAKEEVNVEHSFESEEAKRHNVYKVDPRFALNMSGTAEGVPFTGDAIGVDGMPFNALEDEKGKDDGGSS